MNKTSQVAIISVVLLCVAIVGTLFLDSSTGSRIVNVVTIVSGVIGVITLFYEFRRNRKINTANFLTDYSKSFYKCDYDLYECFGELEKHAVDPKYTFDYDAYSAKIAVYLQWVEAIASLVERKRLDLYTIDNILSYRFFVLVNNPQVQENELVPNAEYYRGTYYLYDKWSEFEKERGIDMPLDQTALRYTKNYSRILRRVKSKLAKKK